MPEPNEIPIELNNWLHIATLGSEKQTREKVRAEAIARYREAWSREVEAGMTETEARDRAIGALGDPWAVRSETNYDGSWHQDVLAPIKKWRRRHKLPKPTDLDSWLAIATFDLCKEAKARIRLEIEAHYLDAMEVLRQNGLDEEQARHEALAGLGAPRAAWRNFRNSDLSQEESQRIVFLKHRYRPLWVGVAKIAIADLVLIGCAAISSQYEIFFLVLLFTLWIFFPMIGKGFCHILSYYTLNAQMKHARPRYILAAIIFYVSQSFIVFALFSITLQVGLRRPVSLDDIVGALASSLFFAALFLLSNLVDTLPLMRRVKKQDPSSKPGGPDQYA